MDNDEDIDTETSSVETEQETETVESNPAAELVDMVVDGNASDAKDAIYSMLYHKVGERIDAMKADMKTAAWDAPEEAPEV